MRTNSNWPVQPTLFIGRRQELAEIGQFLADPACRLLTLLGPGGAGKSRLALAAAEQHASQFRDGIFFVPLQAVPSADDLISAMADALQITFRGQAEPRTQLLDRLRERQMLLVLDNLEHLLTGSGHDAIVDLLSDLVRTAPGVTLLVTSREVLHMQEEWVLPVDGLPYAIPDNDQVSDAVALFADRARRARVDFDLAFEGQAVARICQLVEGNPLALELAAAWTRSLSCTAIVAEIERDLRFLTSQQRNTPARHASIQAVDLDEAVATVREELAALIGDDSAPRSASPATEQPFLPDWLEPLTAREIQVLTLIEQGLSNREIAERLVLSLGTVKWYTSQIYSKLGVRSRSQAVRTARQYDLLS